MKNKAQIHEFDIAIYRIKLWVSITTDLKSLSDRFIDADSEKEINAEFIDNHEAATYYVHQKEKPRYYGVLVATTSKSYLTTNLISHEATHAADFIWSHIAERERGDEANAYLVGWIAECIEKVKKNKIK